MASDGGSVLSDPDGGESRCISDDEGSRVISDSEGEALGGPGGISEDEFSDYRRDASHEALEFEEAQSPICPKKEFKDLLTKFNIEAAREFIGLQKATEIYNTIQAVFPGEDTWTQRAKSLMVRSCPEFIGIAIVDSFVIMTAVCFHIRTSWRGGERSGMRALTRLSSNIS